MVDERNACEPMISTNVHHFANEILLIHATDFLFPAVRDLGKKTRQNILYTTKIGMSIYDA